MGLNRKLVINHEFEISDGYKRLKKSNSILYNRPNLFLPLVSLHSSMLDI